LLCLDPMTRRRTIRWRPPAQGWSACSCSRSSSWAGSRCAGGRHRMVLRRVMGSRQSNAAKSCEPGAAWWPSDV